MVDKLRKFGLSISCFQIWTSYRLYSGRNFFECTFLTVFWRKYYRGCGGVFDEFMNLLLMQFMVLSFLILLMDLEEDVYLSSSVFARSSV